MTGSKRLMVVAATFAISALFACERAGRASEAKTAKTSNADTPLGADLADVAIDDAKRLRPGERVTLSCQRVAGSGDHRWLSINTATLRKS